MNHTIKIDTSLEVYGLEPHLLSLVTKIQVGDRNYKIDNLLDIVTVKYEPTVSGISRFMQSVADFFIRLFDKDESYKVDYSTSLRDKIQDRLDTCFYEMFKSRFIQDGHSYYLQYCYMYHLDEIKKSDPNLAQLIQLKAEHPHSYHEVYAEDIKKCIEIMLHHDNEEFEIEFEILKNYNFIMKKINAMQISMKDSDDMSDLPFLEQKKERLQMLKQSLAIIQS